PYPVVHGGLVDVFYKIVALHRAGVIIHLHCYTDKPEEPQEPELTKYCREVCYYKRTKGISAFSVSLPYIVSSRADPRLCERLLADDHPILLEGIHCTYILQDERFAGRNIILRMLNVEYRYYRNLFRASRQPVKKLYYLNESRL